MAPIRNPYTGRCQSFGGGSGGGGSTCGDYGAQTERAPIPDWGICGSVCEELSEGSCLESEECRGAYVLGCGPEELCEQIDESFYQCWAISPSGPFETGACTGFGADECSRHSECVALHFPGQGNEIGDFSQCGEQPNLAEPGQCQGAIDCASEAPECPDNSFPGIANGCWTGLCIAAEDCEEPASCESLPEQGCVARADCNPLYEGVNCECDDSGCICEEWNFGSCTPGTAQ